MTITVTQEIINNAKHGTVECPVYTALKTAGYDVAFVGVGYVKERLLGNIYYKHKGEDLILSLPVAVMEIIRNYDKTTKMEPFTFELPDLN